MAGIKDKADQIVKEFSQFDDWMDKYQLLIEKGKELPEIEDSEKKEKYLIEGCQSKVWLIPEFKDGKISFRGASDALITKGLTSMVISVYSGHTPDEIISFEPSFIEEAGLSQHLSPNRANGLNAMLKQIKLYAMAYKIQTTPKNQ